MGDFDGFSNSSDRGDGGDRYACSILLRMHLYGVALRIEPVWHLVGEIEIAKTDKWLCSLFDPEYEHNWHSR